MTHSKFEDAGYLSTQAEQIAPTFDPITLNGSS